MSKFNFGYFLALIGIVDFEEKRKDAERRKESKSIAHQIRKRNVSKSLGQHRYVYLSRHSR